MNSIKIYITGGSQGAEYINKELPQIFKDFPYKLKLRHQCGQNNIEKVKNLYFINNIMLKYLNFMIILQSKYYGLILLFLEAAL
jgi:UDP-N-acetylglucosamine--N-acetylmuramyl-(pentapeptide) pyrophosphoryl-undecaprenol N-acetylglucosamine transferase